MDSFFFLYIAFILSKLSTFLISKENVKKIQPVSKKYLLSKI